MLKENFCKGLNKINAEYGCKFNCEKWQLSNGETLIVNRNGDDIMVQASKDVEFYRAVSFLMEKSGDFKLEQKAKFEELSYMIDCSRNGVMKVSVVCNFILTLALNGFNQLFLYTEDTFEVQSQPYFGHMRGKYSAEEIKVIQDECDIFGIELVPCIQTLSHLNAPLKWPVYGDITEYGDTLKVENEKTYQFLDECIGSCRKMFKSDKIHIGMDEACLLAAVSQSTKMKAEDKERLFSAHLLKVNEICKKYEFRPMIWSDMLFKLEDKPYFEKSDNLAINAADRIPMDVTLYYWNYYSDNTQNYDIQLKNHLQLGREIKFAGGAWKWVGFAPYNKWSFLTTVPALKACVANNIKSAMCTAWGDYGDECSNYSVMPVMTLYAEMCYNFEFYEDSIKSRFKTVARSEFDAFILLDIINETYVERGSYKDIKVNNSSKYLLFSDLLNSFFDFNVTEGDEITYYKATIKSLNDAKQSFGKYWYLAQTQIYLASALSIKYDLSIKIKKAYDKKDFKSLKFIAVKTIPLLIKRISEFYKVFEKQWLTEKKSCGLDVQQLRFGAVDFRLKKVAEKLKNFAEKKISVIEELEEKRLPYQYNAVGEVQKYMLNNQFEKIVSANVT